MTDKKIDRSKNSGPVGYNYARRYGVKTVGTRVPEELLKEVHKFCEKKLSKKTK